MVNLKKVNENLEKIIKKLESHGFSLNDKFESIKEKVVEKLKYCEEDNKRITNYLGYVGAALESICNENKCPIPYNLIKKCVGDEYNFFKKARKRFRTEKYTFFEYLPKLKEHAIKIGYPEEIVEEACSLLEDYLRKGGVKPITRNNFYAFIYLAGRGKEKIDGTYISQEVISDDFPLSRGSLLNSCKEILEMTEYEPPKRDALKKNWLK